VTINSVKIDKLDRMSQFQELNAENTTNCKGGQTQLNLKSYTIELNPEFKAKLNSNIKFESSGQFNEQNDRIKVTFPVW
jgi:hypothetical protein